MPAEIYWIPEVTLGRLAVMPRPQAGIVLREDVADWRRAGVTVVVSLLDAYENRELMLEDEAAACGNSNIEFISFPVPDRGVPASIDETVRIVDRIVSLLCTGANVAIHCRLGIGRSPLLAGCVMLRLGFAKDKVFPVLSRARGMKVPDTQLQVQWFAAFDRAIASEV